MSTKRPAVYRVVDGAPDKIKDFMQPYLEVGWELYGAPFQVSPGVVGQAVILPRSREKGADNGE